MKKKMFLKISRAGFLLSIKTLLLLAFIIFFAAVVHTEEPDELITRLSESLYKIGNITIDTETRTISFPAEFNMEEGVIELLLTGRKGKLHESVLKTEIIPSHLQVALLLLDHNYGSVLEYQGDPRTPEGDSLLILINWEDEMAGFTETRIEKLAYNVKSCSPMQLTHWIFAGSKILDGKFMADIEESIITTYHDPFTIIDNPLPTGYDDTFYVVNKSLVPPKGTKAQITIKPYEINKR
jgi:hypothetical protein